MALDWKRIFEDDLDDDEDFKDVWMADDFESILKDFGFKPSGFSSQEPHDPIYNHFNDSGRVTAIIEKNKAVTLFTAWETYQRATYRCVTEPGLKRYLADLMKIVNSSFQAEDLFDAVEGFNQKWDHIFDRPPQQESLLQEGKYSCVMAPAPPELADAVQKWGQMFIPDDELYTDPKDPENFGREHDVHVTCKFGLHETKPSPELLRIIEETQPFEIEIGPCALFDTAKDYDVVKFDVDGEGLRELNRRLSELKNSDEHPEFHPHMTVAYVVKGACFELIGKPLLDPQADQDTRFLVKAVTFSSPNKVKTTLFLGKPNLEESKVINELLDDDEAEEAEEAKEMFGTEQPAPKNFTDKDVDEGDYARQNPAAQIYHRLYADKKDLIYAPLWYHERGLQQTASGYGAKLVSSYKIMFNGKIYRIYTTCYGNSGSSWFIAKGRKIYVH
jgi:hypothetical protein